MLETFFATLSPMLVMFICILIGFLLNKAKLAPANSAAVLSKLETYALLPALIVHTFVNYCTVESIRGQYSLILFGVLGVAVSIVAGTILARFFSRDPYQRSIYRYGLMSANFGFLGNAIVPQILGDAALYPYMLFTLPLSAMVYGWCIQTLIPKGEKRGSTLKNLMNPTFIAMLIGILLGLLNVGKIMPSFLSSTISSLSGCMGPVAMILTGFVIGDYDFVGLLKLPKVYVATILRLIVLPVLFIAVFWLLGADETVLVMSLFAFGTPLGLNTVVIPAAYGGDTKIGAAMAMISHVACIISIPLLYALLETFL